MLHFANGRLRSGPPASYVRLAKHYASCRPQQRIDARWQSAAASKPGSPDTGHSLSMSSQARYNEIGVQQLSSHIYSQIFPDGNTPPPKHLIEMSKDHLRRHELLGKNTDNSDPIAFDLPSLQGRTLDEHFHKLGLDAAEPYLSYAKDFSRFNSPPKPRKWVRRSGWTKYYPDGRTEVVNAPDDAMLCFDTEVLWKESSFAVMACASSPNAWELRERIATQTDDAQLAELLSNSAIRQEEEELWVERSSVNSLRDVAKFHLDVTIDKAIRDDFSTLDRAGVLAKLDELLDYCAADVAITHRVYQIVFPNFLETCPHPVSFAALRHLSSVILPVNETWNAYIANAEATYHELNDAVLERLVALAEKAVAIRDQSETWSNDPWLNQLDWSGQEIKMVKGKKKNEPPRPAARQKKPGMPRWYKDLFAKNDAPIGLTVRTRIAPLLLKLAWDGHPLCWSDTYGWTFRVSRTEASKYLNKQMTQCDMADEKVEALRQDTEGVYFKLPHKDGPTARCANPMAKSYLSYFENGTLSSEYSYAKEALEMNASCSYWISARDRIKSQMVVYEEDVATEKLEGGMENKNTQGFILPQIIPMGTITRRAVENTWLTASNAKRNRVGSELKAMVKAPPGYSFVGADVDSQELWIASLVGDATFKLHGGNAIGFMTLEGTKAAGTDLHSRTAGILGITRNDAKVFNYGRIYGAGLKFAAQLLRQFDPNLSEKETLETASKLYVNTKGTKTNRKVLYKRPFWRGGTESFVFNKLEEFAEQERPRTPVLGAGITEALMGRFINKGGYLTSRINWAIQSSGVDYLHLLIVTIPHGESLDINALLDKGDEARLDPSIVPDPALAPKLDDIIYTPRVPVMETLEDPASKDLSFLKAQITSDENELREVLKEQRKTLPAATKAPKKSARDVLPYRSHPILVPREEPLTVADALGNKFTKYDGKAKWDWKSQKTGYGRGPSSRI
ncbi:DNA polymerase gamma [Verticillium alfalfae VaMs.102]|uniref:DNA-directed DNA polymerase n=1 Tax=Verticillium alfalfae (strain VaMs.102 / ATCC MYA-4576 / FGSC 10136) TaxID=526221 RepID=C9SPL1_VERA1|nr:DNA polymerase gamma [Verticillium alfalfae VaMs.102]EEY20726.1 DNA polymerase gamma [Verticillium alfalfae VaMs.102]